MSVIATAVKHLMAAGVIGDALVAAIAEMEAELRPTDAAAEKRRAWDRERKRRQKEERNSTGIPPDPVESAENAEKSPSLDKSPQTPKINPNPAGEIRARKATRLATDWKPCPIAELPDALRSVAETWAAGEYDRQAAIFLNHWISASGANASKRDWQRAWQNWLYRAEERGGVKRAPAGISAKGVSAAPPPAVSRDGECEKSKSIRRVLKEKLGQRTYESWIKPTAIIVTGGNITVRCGSDFMVNWLQQHHEDDIRRACSDALGRPAELRFIATGAAIERARSAAPKGEHRGTAIGAIAKPIITEAAA